MKRNKMKKYKFNILIIAFLVTFTSCDDMLDFYPELSRNDANTWTSASAFEKEANNYYTWLPSIQDRGNIEGIAYRDAYTDLVATIGNTISTSTYTQKDTENKYTDYYKHIRSINYLFKNADEYYPGNKSDLAQYIAEAHFFRAYESFIFFRDFGPGTIVKTVVDPTAGEVTAPRASRDEFVDFMIEDLEAAINSGAMPAQKNIRGTNDDGRMTVGAANALLARICLFEGTWQKYHTEMDSEQGTTASGRETRSRDLLQKAKKAAEAVLTEGSYELFYSDKLGDASYKYMFTLQNTVVSNPGGVLKSANTEYIFRNRFHDANKVSNQNVIHTYSNFKVTKLLIDVFETKDGTPKDYSGITLDGYCNSNVDSRFSEVAIPHMGYYWSYASSRTDYSTQAGSQLLNKPDLYPYINKWSLEFKYDANASAFDVPIIRLGGLYLDYAEILCELNGGAAISVGDNEHINLVRKRAGMPTKSSWTLEQIRNERVCELYLEGYRIDDIRRWAKGPELLGRDLTGLYLGRTESQSSDNLHITYTVAPKEIPADIANYQWVKLAKTTTASSDPDYIWCFHDTKQALPTYAAAKSLKLYGSSSTNYAKSDPTNVIKAANEDPATYITNDGFYIAEPASKRTFYNRMYMLPLPKVETDLNPNLKQNPGWND